MTFGKDAPPLPMYEYKVLKHVPTMVRRRYDRDLDHKLSDATLDLSSKDGESRGDDGAEDSTPAAVIDLYDLVVNNEAEETQTYTEDFRCNEFGQSTNDSKSESGGAKDADLTSNKDANVEDEIEGDYAKLSDNEKDDSKSESKDVIDANVEDKIEGNGDVKTDNEQGLCSEDGKKEDNAATNEGTLENFVDSSVKNEVQEREQDLSVIEDSKSEDNGTKDADIACDYVGDNVQDKFEDIDHEKSDNEPGICSEDCKDEDDGAIDAKILADNEDACVKFEVQDNELVQDSRSEDNGTEDVNNISYNVDDSVQDEVEDKALGISDSKKVDMQHMLVEDCKSKADATKGASVDSYNMKNSAKDEVLDIEHDNKQDDCKIYSEGVEHDDLSTYEDVSVEVQDKGVESFTDEQDFSPKAFKETLERDGIDLCCPKCKNNITHTMIYRKKEDSQLHQTTCYNFLTALFSCMHSMVVHWRTNYRSHSGIGGTDARS